jgi:hypothetical protein
MMLAFLVVFLLLLSGLQPLSSRAPSPRRRGVQLQAVVTDSNLIDHPHAVGSSHRTRSPNFGVGPPSVSLPAAVGPPSGSLAAAAAAGPGSTHRTRSPNFGDGPPSVSLPAAVGPPSGSLVAAAAGPCAST